jgi:hypothetical protein
LGRRAHVLLRELQCCRTYFSFRPCRCLSLVVRRH